MRVSLRRFEARGHHRPGTNCYGRSTMREIPQRELRNNVTAVLREVEAGESLRVTVRGRAVAELVPVVAGAECLTGDDVLRIRREAPLDAAFLSDVEKLAGGTIDEL